MTAIERPILSGSDPVTAVGVRREAISAEYLFAPWRRLRGAATHVRRDATSPGLAGVEDPAGWKVLAIVFLVYLAGARIAFWIISVTGLAAVMFAPAGVTVGALLLLRYRQWPLVIAGAGAAELLMNLSMGLGWSSLGYVAANTVEPLIGATLTLALVGRRPLLSRRRHLQAFLAGAVIAGPIAGGVIGGAAAVGLGRQEFFDTMWQWWLGDALGVLVVGALILTWNHPEVQRPTSPVGRTVLLAMVIVGTVAVLAATDLPLLFLAFSLIVVAGVLFDVRTVAIIAFAAAVTSTAWLLFEQGTLFSGIDDGGSLVIVKLKLLVFATAGLIVGAEAAERVRASLAAARLADRADAERQVVEKLQRLLLPPEHQSGDGYAVTGLYVAAASEFGVGGDWYEVAELSDGRVLIAIGDIVGSGPDAAADTGRMRGLISGLATTALDVEELLASFESAALGLGGRVVASTVWIGLYDPSRRELAYTSAGHPPGFVAAANGVHRLESGLNPPLGVLPGGPKAGRSTVLSPDAALVLYTDGLIERRGRSIDAGLDALETVLRHRTMDPADILVAVNDRTRQPPAQDDTIILTVTFDPVTAGAGVS